MFDAKQMTRRDVAVYTGDIAQLGGVKRYRLCGGRADGVEAVDFKTGSGLDFTVVPGRGMDIAWAHYGKIPIAYMAKAGIAAAPYYEADGMGWLHNFYAGMMTTCGLSNVGGPCGEEHPVIGKRNYGLHGRIANIPAEQVCVSEQWEDGIYRMRASGLCRQGCLHAEHLTLRREVGAALGHASIEIRDEIENLATTEEAMMLMYHINVGFPVLSADSIFVCSSKSVHPADERAEREAEDYRTFLQPQAGYEERCYLHELKPDAEGYAHAAVLNEELGIGFAVSCRTDALPCLNQWKMMKEGEYVLGIEPCNCPPVGRTAAAARGILPMLQPGEAARTNIILRVLDGKKAMEDFAAKISKI